jgi:hypothetical protein
MMFMADGVKISTKADNSVSITFTSGEYQRREVLDAYLTAQSKLEQGEPVEIEVT